MNTYEIGQTFEDAYPPEAAMWCNGNGLMITELVAVDGKRQFQIVEVPQQSSTELRIVELKANIAATDSIVLEMAENALLNGGMLVMPTDTEATDYATVLSNRAAWRAELAELS